MKKFFSSGKAKARELEKFHSACKEWGIFQLVNHGVDGSWLGQEIHEFYALPLEEKLRYKIRAGEFEGYGQNLLGDHKVEWGDRFYMITNPPEEASSLPRALEGFMSEALKIDANEMEEMFEDGMQSVRMNYYPPYPEPDKVIGLMPHSDGSAVTILLQVNGVQGLQIKKDGIWMPVKFLKKALVVNLGDIVEVNASFIT